MCEGCGHLPTCTVLASDPKYPPPGVQRHGCYAGAMPIQHRALAWTMAPHHRSAEEPDTSLPSCRQSSRHHLHPRAPDRTAGLRQQSMASPSSSSTAETTAMTRTALPAPDVRLALCAGIGGSNIRRSALKEPRDGVSSGNMTSRRYHHHPTKNVSTLARKKQ